MGQVWVILCQLLSFFEIRSGSQPRRLSGWQTVFFSGKLFLRSLHHRRMHLIVSLWAQAILFLGFNKYAEGPCFSTPHYELLLAVHSNCRGETLT